MGWDIDVREKVYQRLANEIFFRILRGEYALGAKLPSYIEIAKKAGSSPETLRKAFRELQQHGVIESNRQIILRSDIKLLQPFASWSNSL